MKAYQKSNIPLAKELRKNMTPWERKLWYEFLRYYPVRFHRQKAIGNYIVDFYCAKAGLVLELDGGGHYTPEQKQADRIRTQALEQMGLKVIRICNLDIDRNFSGVCEFLDIQVRRSLLQSKIGDFLQPPHQRGPWVLPHHSNIFAVYEIHPLLFWSGCIFPYTLSAVVRFLTKDAQQEACCHSLSCRLRYSAGSLLAQSFLPPLFLKVHNPLSFDRGLAINQRRSAGSLRRWRSR